MKGLCTFWLQGNLIKITSCTKSTARSSCIVSFGHDGI